MMPYARFHEAAEAVGYDLEVLAARFGASFEQTAHRLTTLGRPTARGIPFFLVRVDIAGNVSKRFSAGAFSVLTGRGHLRPVEPARDLRRAGPDPHAGDRTAGWRPLVLDGPDRAPRDQPARQHRAALRPRARLRDQIRQPPDLRPAGSISRRPTSRRSASTAASATARTARSAPPRRRCDRWRWTRACAACRRSRSRRFEGFQDAHGSTRGMSASAKCLTSRVARTARLAKAIPAIMPSRSSIGRPIADRAADKIAVRSASA